MDFWQNLFYRKPGKVHIMGICGAGASSIAWILHMRGWQVSGCDQHIPPEKKESSTFHGITIEANHDIAHVKDIDVLIYSAAIKETEEERRHADPNGVLCISRGKALAAWINASHSISICGTHGKTTTSCFTTRLLQLVKADPSWCLGGYTSQLGSAAGPVDVKKYDPELGVDAINTCLTVAESDESDGTIALQEPAITIITNLDKDHVDYFKSDEELETCFQNIIQKTRKALAVCTESPRAMKVATYFKGPVCTFGFSQDAIVQASEIIDNASSTSFRLTYKTDNLGIINLPVPGKHNILNALAAFCAASLHGIDPHIIAQHLAEACEELPKRRFQWIKRSGKVKSVIDYSHHPVEIAAAMSIALRQKSSRLRVIFQPHRYSRTKALINDFPNAFNHADEVIILPTYAATEQLIRGGEAHDLYAVCRKAYPNKRFLLSRSIDEVYHYLTASAKEGDLILILGAGDVKQLEQMLRNGPQLPLEHSPYYTMLRKVLPKELHFNEKVSMTHQSFYGVGGDADLWIEIESIPTLCALLIACNALQIPAQIAGAGANAWNSDLGLKGVVYKLKGEAFKQYTRQGNKVTVGSAHSGTALLNKLEADGLSGLEFMQGIPGQVGGWTCMNAGAFQFAFWNYVESLEYVVKDGQKIHNAATNFQAGYRSVRGLKGITIIAVTLNLTPSTPDKIRAKRNEYAAKRVKIQNLHTCGSVFRNPTPTQSAGMLLDQSGAKEFRIGGAYVTEQHANIIATDKKTATASDVLALMLSMQSLIHETHNITLENEVTGFNHF